MINNEYQFSIKKQPYTFFFWNRKINKWKEKENIKNLKMEGAVGEVRGENRWIGGRKRFDQFKGGL